MRKRPQLHVIPGTTAPDTPKERVRKRLRLAEPAYLIQCPRCGGREVIETKVGVVKKNGKASGGTKCYVCALCLMRGERVVAG